MYNNHDNDNMLIYVISFVFFTAVCIWLINKYSAHIIGFMVSFSIVELCPVSIFSQEGNYVRSRISEMRPENLLFSQALAQMNYAGRWYSWFAIPFFLYIGWKGWNANTADRFCRKLNMKTLLRNNLEHNPCIAPIINWPRSILEENNNSGYWATGMQPLQLVARYELLYDLNTKQAVPPGKLLDNNDFAKMDSDLLKSRKSSLGFDRDKAQKVLVGQFGPLYTSIEALPSHLKKLAVAFYFYGADRKEQGQSLLDEMSLSFRAPFLGATASFLTKPPFFRVSQAAHGFILDTALSSEHVKVFKEMENVVKAHSRYMYLAVLALYAFARKKGVLPTSEFIWLRPLDRRMFYLCNNMGRRTAWPEIAGLWAHFLTEKALASTEPDSRGIEEPQVGEGINGLEMSMYEEGWIDELSAAAKRGLLEDPAPARGI